jgi:hypothetical protein
MLMSRDGGSSDDPSWSCAITPSDPETPQTPAPSQPRAGSPRQENLSAPDGFRVGESAQATPGSAKAATKTPIPNRVSLDPFTAVDRAQVGSESQRRNG